jgi:hypothetical protein
MSKPLLHCLLPLVLLGAGDAMAQAPAPRSPAPAAASAPLSPASAANCQRLREQYYASQSCYAPYRLAGGGVRPEAIRACGPAVLDPSWNCGIETKP